MVLDTSGFKGGGPIASLIEDVVAECAQKEFIGIVIDAGTRPDTPAQQSLSKSLASAAAKHKLLYFVPEELASSGENAIIRVSTALSGGTLSRHISDAAGKYGAGRVALEAQRIVMDFTLPARSGIGKALTATELLRLKERHNATSFFSPDLAVNYFTYRDKKGAHFVLHDDAQSIRRKLSTGISAGVKHVFLFYPQVADIYDSLFF